MTATWTANRTWVAGEVVTAALLNQYLRDNLDWLASRGLTPTEDYDGTVGSTTSGTFTDIGSSFAFTTVKANAKVLCVSFGTVLGGTNADDYALTLSLDGTNLGDTTRGLLYIDQVNNWTGSFCFMHIEDVATAGAHTLKLQARRAAGATSSVTVSGMQLWAWELA